MEVRVSTQFALRALLLAFVVLFVGHVAGLTLHYGFGHDYAYGFVPLFDFDQESNLPTLYSTLILLLCAGMAALIASDRKGGATSPRHWWGMALILTYIAIDEAASIHEMTIEPLRETFNVSGWLYYAWVIPYGVVALLVAAYYLPFLLRLPRTLSLWIVLAGCLYLGGALGFEMLSGYVKSENGGTFLHALLTTIEETLEMLGLLVLFHALSTYLSKLNASLRFVAESEVMAEDTVEAVATAELAVASQQ